MAPLSAALIRTELTQVDHGIIGNQLHFFPQVASTNDLARELAEDRLTPEGTLVITDEQTAGRGRMGRHWDAPPETSLLMSVIFRPALAPDQINRLVMACGLAIAEGCEEIAGVSVDMKWPNDLLIGGRKFTGILPESGLIGNMLAWVIVGMGVNVNQTFSLRDPLFETATSLRMVTGQEINRAQLLAHILAALDRWHVQLHNAILIETWRSRCVNLGQRIRVQVGTTVVEGRADELDDIGALWLTDGAGVRHRLLAGEATVL